MMSDPLSTLSPGAVKAVVFTDMDGTLIDHDTYEFTAAMPALEALKRRKVPLVLCSSKTRVELLEWQRRLGIEGPLIVENGGGVFLRGMKELEPGFPELIAKLPAITLGSSYGELRAALGRISKGLGVSLAGFGDMSHEQIVQMTGLSVADASRAARRDFDEPFLWATAGGGNGASEGALAKKCSELARAEGLRVTRGGRFWHLTGDSDKGKAVRWVREHLFPEAVSLALGDSGNDLEMLGEVDRGVLVELPGGGHLAKPPSGLRCVAGVGPVGWNAAVLEWLEDSAL